MAELAAGNTSAEAVVADTDGVIFELICEIIVSFSHGTDENTNALVLAQALDVILDSDYWRIETERDLAAVRRQVIRDGILDDVDQLLLRGRRTNRKTVQQLDHQTGKPLESTWYPHRRADLDEHILRGMDVNLEFASLVDRRVEEGQKTLYPGEKPWSKTQTTGIITWCTMSGRASLMSRPIFLMTPM